MKKLRHPGLVLAIAALLLRMREEKPAEGEDDTVDSTG